MAMMWQKKQIILMLFVTLIIFALFFIFISLTSFASKNKNIKFVPFKIEIYQLFLSFHLIFILLSQKGKLFLFKKY